LQQSFPCPKCSAQIAVGQHFCNSCGQHFEYRCHNCGSAISTLSGLCTNCGKKLHQQAQATAWPAAQKAKVIPQKIKTGHQTETTRTVDQVSRYLILIAIIIFTGAILYVVGTASQGETTNWSGGSFSFGGHSPPSAPPPSTPSNKDTQADPNPEHDIPQYTASQVIAEAKRMSPDCQRFTTRRS
jgi:predicted RNA-binding Zn-ribbon protein involved in translation (DUF1610 family)